MGGEQAQGYNINMAWSNALMGDAEYIEAVNRILLPVAYEVWEELGVWFYSGVKAGQQNSLFGCVQCT